MSTKLRVHINMMIGGTFSAVLDDDGFTLQVNTDDKPQCHTNAFVVEAAGDAVETERFTRILNAMQAALTGRVHAQIEKELMDIGMKRQSVEDVPLNSDGDPELN